MSTALKYLSSVRPEAMGAYFEFLKANGKSLDETTRALISVITKVATQTENGLVQYSRKALENGVSEDEILDAIMMAFPALGLSKVVWAVDVLLAQKLLTLPDEAAERSRSIGSDPGEADLCEWHELCALKELVANVPKIISVDGHSVFVTASADNVRAFDAKCPHHDSNLAAVQIKRNIVECPMHGWRFSAATGECVRGGRNLTERPTKISDNCVFAFW